MADQLYLFTGTNFSTAEIELALDTNSTQALTPGTEMGVAEHRNLWQQTGHSGDVLINHEKSNRSWPVRLLVGDNDSLNPADSLGTALNTLERLITQARRYETVGDVDRVCLYLKLDGATKPTYYQVKDMECNGLSLLEEISRIFKNAQASFVLTTEPLGFGEEEVILNANLTPHFQQDINADGLADNWNWSGTPVTSLDTAQFLCGSQSQSVIVDDSTTEGITADTIACTAYQSDDFVSYVWVFRISGSDEITFDVVGDDSGSLGTAEYGAATTTIVGPDGNTWSRLEVIGTVGAADTTLTLRVERLTGDANEITRFFVDKTFTQFNTDTIPTAWSSQYKIYQHADSAEGAVCYLDIEDVPGDSLADIKFNMYYPSGITGTPGYFYIGKRSNDRVGAALGYHMNVDGDTINAARIGGYEFVETPTGAWDAVTDGETIGSIYINGKAGIYRVFVSCRDENSDSSTDAERADFRLAVQMNSGAVSYSSPKKFPELANATYYLWVDMGTIDLSRTGQRNVFNSVPAAHTAIYSVEAKRDSGSHDVHIDAVRFIPVEEDSLFVFDGSEVQTDYSETLLGLVATNFETVEDTVYYIDVDLVYNIMETAGNIPRLKSKGFHRIQFLPCTYSATPASKFVSALDAFIYVRTTYIPRTAYLFGA